MQDVQSSRDVKLLNEIESRLKGRFQLYEINVYIDEGVVILAGTVDSTDVKRAIELEVKKIGGVNKIRNRIQVRK